MSDRSLQKFQKQWALEESALPAFHDTPLSERFGRDAQLLCDQAFNIPSADLPRVVLADLLESKGEEALSRYIRVSIEGTAPTECTELLNTHRREWTALFVPDTSPLDDEPKIHFQRGLPSTIETNGSFIWEGWFSPVTIPLQRLLVRYGTPLDKSLRSTLSNLAHYARESREGTGLHETAILQHTAAPVLERLDPVASHEDLLEAVSRSIMFMRELHERGLDTGRCPRSCLGTAIRASQRVLKVSDIHDLALNILVTVDACEGKGAIRGAVCEGLLPLIGTLADVRAQEPLRAYLPVLSEYVTGLARIGVPIEPVMRHHFLGIAQGLARDPSPHHFAELTAQALLRTHRG
jgi:hypothetical protein